MLCLWQMVDPPFPSLSITAALYLTVNDAGMCVCVLFRVKLVVLGNYDHELAEPVTIDGAFFRETLQGGGN